MAHPVPIPNPLLFRLIGRVDLSGTNLASDILSNLYKPSTTAWRGDKMTCREVINIRLLAIGLALLFAIGCASTRGAVGVGWGDHAPHPEVKVAHKKGPPPHAPAHGYRAKHSYHYYSSNEVYYDAGRRIYFYIEGGHWVADALLPYHLRVSLGDYETVEMYSDTPYEYHRKFKSKGRHKVPPGHAKKNKN